MPFRALRIIETPAGKFERSIEELDLEDLPPGELLVKVVYSSLNYKDALSATGNKGITKKYPPTISFGPILIAENRMPIVGRMKDFDVAGGWAGIGVVAGFAAADAYADWIVHGNDEKLKLFEAMQPGKFSPEFAPKSGPAIPENASI